MNRQIDLSPTRRAAEQLSWLLPHEDEYGGEAWRFFHMQTNDYCTMVRTVKLACELRGLSAPYFISIEQFCDLATDEDAKNKKKKNHYYDFQAAWDRADELNQGSQVFVWQAFNRIHPDVADELKYGRLMLEFLHFCEEEREIQLSNRAAGKSAEIEHPLSKQVVFLSYGLYFPMSDLLRDSLRTINYPSLTEEDFMVLLQEYWQRNQNRRLRALGNGEFADALLGAEKMPVFERRTLEWYANYMAGIQERNVRRLFAELPADFPAGNVDFNRFDIIESHIIGYKNAILKQHNRLEVLEKEGGQGGTKKEGKDWEVKGLDAVETWLKDHKKTMRAKGLASAGILLVGIPGTGKSQTAKMAARILELPLVRLDMSKILGGYVGDSEKGMREMLSDLEYAAPCVLWIDEIEKAMGGSDGKSGDSGVMQRLFGMLLTFMQENDKAVFSVTTANDIGRLPPEFFRNGRFDQAFCVMMPEYKGCCDIMADKLTARMRDRGWLGPGQRVEESYARRVFDACVGTKREPRFLTGADIEAHVKELFCLFGQEWGEMPGGEETAAAMRKVAQRVRAQAFGNSSASMRDIASRYLDMLQRGLTMAGSGATPFVQGNLDIDRVRYYQYKKGDEALPEDCMIHPDPGKYRENLESDAAEQWYDARFFQCLVEQMNEIVIYDRELTLEETRQAYWKLKSEGGGKG